MTIDMLFIKTDKPEESPSRQSCVALCIKNGHGQTAMEVMQHSRKLTRRMSKSSLVAGLMNMEALA